MGLTAVEASGSAGLVLSCLTLDGTRATLLDGLSLSLPPARLTAIIGGGVSGRAALLDVLAGFARAQGTILLDGQDITRWSVRRRGFGIAGRSDILFPHLTLARNVAFPLRVRGVPRDRRHALAGEMMELLHLGPATGALLPAQASQAERRRAVLARAAIAAPRLLLLDEPLCGQDDASRAALLAGLRQVQALSGAMMLLFSANGTDALALADDVAVLRRGGVVQHGTAQEVFDHPRDPAVAALLGETNALRGHVEAIDEDVAVIRLACGPCVEARPDMALQRGDACLVTLRPDRIAVAAVPAADMGEAATAATLIEVRFIGEVYRLRLLIGSGAELVVRRPAGAGLRGLSVGSTISVAWQPHHARASPVSALDGGRALADS